MARLKKSIQSGICMESPDGKNAINRYQLKEQHLLHRYKEPVTNYDLMGIVCLYIWEITRQDTG